MIDMLKVYFCKGKYLFSEGDIAFKKSASNLTVVVRICKKTTINSKPAYQVMQGLASELVVVPQEDLTMPEFTKGCLVNLMGLVNPARVIRPSVSPMVNGLQGYKLEMLNGDGEPYKIPCTGFRCPNDFLNVGEFNTFNPITNQWSIKK